MNRRLSATFALAVAISLSVVGAAPVGAATEPYLVKDINSTGSSRPTWLTDLGNTLYFVAKGGAKGRELWKSNGTSAGTVRLKDIRPGSASSGPEYLTVVNGRTTWTRRSTTARCGSRP